eukprot:CAMPEP_0175472512 /NCGR_PEP_ID=MMETSP0095-20121207/73907_1 /TAXON_ID=311494 /ORGANISM="Alexandrium monilatum, Strain CCMP3105" /LENGTH=810 /DNA_ID=CAMNT_0016773985 /DNA_START=59 /DNA_END=2491 /DNA_ORIENTATION=-
MARPLLKFTLTGARPATSLPDTVTSSPAIASSAPDRPRVNPVGLEILPKDFVLLSPEGAAASRIVAAAAGSGALFAFVQREAGKAGSQWWMVLDAAAATSVAAGAESRPVVALRVVRRSPSEGQPPDALAVLSRQLTGAGLQPWPLAAGEEELLLVDRARLVEAALVLVRSGHAVGPPPRLGLQRDAGELCAADVEKFCGVWRLTSRERPLGTVVEKYSRGDGPVRIQAPNGVYAELVVRNPGEVVGQDSCCGTLTVSDEAGQVVTARHIGLSFAPPVVGPRRCRVVLDEGGGDEGEDVAVETLIADSGSSEVERWERVGTGEVTVLELKAIDPRPRGSHGHAGFWLFCGRHWARVTGLPLGQGLVAGACCRSLAQARELYGEDSVATEMRANFDACSGILERPGFLSVLRKAWSTVGDPIFFDASKSRSEVRKDGDVIIHSPGDGPTTLWDVRAFAMDPFTPVPKRLIKPTAPEGLRRRGQSSSSEASSSTAKSSRARAEKRSKRKARDTSSDLSRPAKKKDRDRSRSRDQKTDRSRDRDRGRKAVSSDSGEDAAGQGRDRGRDRDRGRSRADQEHSSDSSRNRDRDRDGKAKDRDRSHERSRKGKDRHSSHDKDSDKDKEKGKDTGNDREKKKDKDKDKDRKQSCDRDRGKNRKDHSRSCARDRDKDKKRKHSSSSSEPVGKSKDRHQSRKRDSSDDSKQKKPKATPKKKKKPDKRRREAERAKRGKSRRREASSSSSSSARKKTKRKAKKASSSQSSSSSSTAKEDTDGGDAGRKRKSKASSSEGEAHAAGAGRDGSSSDGEGGSSD